MIRAIVQYESEPDPERYRQHVEEFVQPVECSAFRHGKVFGSPFGEPSTATTPSSSGPTWSRSRLPRARRRSLLPGRTR